MVVVAILHEREVGSCDVTRTGPLSAPFSLSLPPSLRPSLQSLVCQQHVRTAVRALLSSAPSVSCRMTSLCSLLCIKYR